MQNICNVFSNVIFQGIDKMAAPRTYFDLLFKLFSFINTALSQFSLLST